MAPIIYNGIFFRVQLKGPATEMRLTDLNMRPGRVTNWGKTGGLRGRLKGNRYDLRKWSVVGGIVLDASIDSPAQTTRPV